MCVSVLVVNDEQILVLVTIVLVVVVVFITHTAAIADCAWDHKKYSSEGDRSGGGEMWCSNNQMMVASTCLTHCFVSILINHPIVKLGKITV